MKSFFFISLISILAVASAAAQDAVLKIVDAVSGEAVPYVHVRIVTLDGSEEWLAASKIDGSVSNPLKKNAEVTVSCIGFKPFVDTVAPGENKILRIFPAVLEMDEVVVTAQFKPQRADQSIYPVRVISPAKINSKASPDLRDLLSDELSMRITQDGALGSNLSLRGLSGEHIKFLVDGVPIIGRMNGNIDLGQLNLNNIAHVEVIEGPMSVVYGSNALAGVVNIITRDNFAGQYRAKAETYLESVGTYNFSLLTSARYKRHSWSISGSRNFFQGWSPEDEGRSQLWKPKRQYDAEIWYAYRTNKGKIRTSLKYFHELLKNKGALLPPYFETAFDANFYTRRWTAKVDGSHKLAENTMLQGTAAYSHYNREKETLFKDLTTLSEVRTANDEDQDTTGFSSVLFRGMITHGSQKSRISFQAGTDINHEFGEGKRITDKSQDIGDYAAFATFQFRPWSMLELQPGLRYSYNTRYDPPLVWSVHFKFTPLEKLIFRGSLSRGFRAPSLKELYLYFVDINHNIQGNENLKAEHSWNTGLSAMLSGKHGKFNWSGELHVFQNDIENIITLAQTEGTLYTYVNVEDYHTHGAELKTTLAWYPVLTIRPGLSYTGRTSAINNENNSGEYRYSTDVNTSISIHPKGSDWEFSAFYKYTGQLPQFYLDEDGKLSEGFIDDYHTLDFSIARYLLDRQLNLSVGVKNVFNNTDINITGGTSGVHGSSGGSLLAGYGRTYFFKLSYSLSHVRQEN